MAAAHRRRLAPSRQLQHTDHKTGDGIDDDDDVVEPGPELWCARSPPRPARVVRQTSSARAWRMPWLPKRGSDGGDDRHTDAGRDTTGARWCQLGQR
eukprot:SAG11_NODE_247_length_11679_cov_6.170898_12_plen_97_part_00